MFVQEIEYICLTSDLDSFPLLIFHLGLCEGTKRV